MDSSAAILAFVFTSLRLSTPLAYATLGGYCSERSGTINIALEGLMLSGAFTAAVIAHQTGSASLGVVAGICGGVIMASLHAFLCITLKADQIISGMAVNLLALGLPPVISKALYDASGGTPLLDSASRIPSLEFTPMFTLSPLVLGVIVITLLFWLFHTRTRLGQYLRFAGEHPLALQSQGIGVRRIRWLGVLFSGALCGLAGTYLSIDHSGGFSRNMTAGRGFIALAALIIGRWHPVGAVLAALVFGVIEATQILLQGISLPGGQTVPVQWIQMLPYIATLVILAGVVGGRWGRSRAPRALGTPL